MKITKLQLKKLIKEELKSLSEASGPGEVDGRGFVEIAKILMRYGIGIRNARAWIQAGLRDKHLDLKASPMDTDQLG